MPRAASISLKRLLTCAAESINLAFSLQLAQPPYAASTETLDKKAKVRNDLNRLGKPDLAQRSESVLDSGWYKDLKWLRDKATHRGVANYVFARGGAREGAYLKNRNGSGRTLPVKEDLEEFRSRTAEAIYSWAELLA